MDNNISLSKVHVTPEFSLVIKSLSLEDAGIYRCHGKEGQESKNKFNYRLERNTEIANIYIFHFNMFFKHFKRARTPNNY